MWKNGEKQNNNLFLITLQCESNMYLYTCIVIEQCKLFSYVARQR